MRDTVKESKKYNIELESLRIFSKDDTYIESHIAVLEKTAIYGIPTLTNLQQEFSTISEKILKQSLLKKPNKTLLDKVALKFSSVVHIRKVSGDESSKANKDIFARASRAIESGNIELAISELNKLSEPDLKTLDNWIEKSKNYVNSINAAEAIFKYSSSLL